MLKTAAVILAIASSSCHVTRTYRPGTDWRSPGKIHTEHQFFTMAGLAPISRPSGSKCAYGMDWLETSQGFADTVVSLGLVVAGAVLATKACPSIRGGIACPLVLGTGPPFLVSTRTVKYSCVERSTQQETKPGKVPARGWRPILPKSTANDTQLNP